MPSKIFDTSGEWEVPDNVRWVRFTLWGGGAGGATHETGSGGGGGGAANGKEIKAPTGTYDIVIGEGGDEGENGGDTIVSRSSTEICRAAGGATGDGATGGAGGVNPGGGGFGSPGNDGGIGGFGQGDAGGGGGGSPPITAYDLDDPFEPPPYMWGKNASVGGFGGGEDRDGGRKGGAGGNSGEDGQNGTGHGAGGGGAGTGGTSGNGKPGRVLVQWDLKFGSDCCCEEAVCISGSANEGAMVLPPIIHVNVQLPGAFGAMVAAGNPYRLLASDPLTGFAPSCCVWYSLDGSDEICGEEFVAHHGGTVSRLRIIGANPADPNTAVDPEGSGCTSTYSPGVVAIAIHLKLHIASNGAWAMSAIIFIRNQGIHQIECPFPFEENNQTVCGAGFGIASVYGTGTLSVPNWSHRSEITAGWGNSTAFGGCVTTPPSDLEDEWPEETVMDELAFFTSDVLYSYTFDDATVGIL